jgi:hypothetical protein
LAGANGFEQHQISLMLHQVGLKRIGGRQDDLGGGKSLFSADVG